MSVVSEKLDSVKAHWEKEETISLKDKVLQKIERASILNYLKTIQPESIADIGCGDCSDTIHFCKYAKKVYAFDYSNAMLKKAIKYKNNKIVLSHLDLLTENIDVTVDLALTKRCLINLGEFNNQKKAIKKIYDCLKPEGYYLMLECSVEGLDNLNGFRSTMELKCLDQPFHNSYFYLDSLCEFLRKLFIIEKIQYFSEYYFFTRFYNQLLKKEDYFIYDNLARKIYEKISFLDNKNIGAQFLIVLKKKNYGC